MHQTFTNQEHAALLQWRQHPQVSLSNRAAILLLLGEGKSAAEVSVELGISQSTVQKWQREWQKNRLAIFPAEEAVEAQPIYAAGQPSHVGDWMLTRPDETMQEVTRQILLYQLSVMLFYQEIALEGRDPEGVHKMRVATRRMRSAYRLLGDYMDESYQTRIVKPLRKTARVLGAVRDLDVFILKTREYVDKELHGDVEGLAPLFALLDERYAVARGKLLNWIGSKRYEKFVQRFQTVLMNPLSQLSDRVKYAAPPLIYEHMGHVRRYHELLPDADLGMLHQLRIEFKRLRYTLEFFEGVLGNETAALIKEVKHMQELLGDLNDAVVAVDLLDDLMAHLPPDDHAAVQAYQAFRGQEIESLVAQVPTYWEKFNREQNRQRLASAIAAL